MTNVAWMGTGLLGAGFVEAMCKRGERVRVWNRTADKARALTSAGAEVCESPADAARGATRIHLCLSDDRSVDEVLAAIGPIGEGVVVVDHTTVSPEGARARARRLTSEGRVLLGCPVFMGPANARAATGIMLCAGPPETVARLRPELAKMTGKLLEHGEDVGVVAALKLFGNALIMGVTGAMSDALTVASASGVSPEDALGLLQFFDVGAVVKMRGARMAEGNHAASFELSMARKDVRLMQESAGGRPLAVLPSLAARMDALLEEGHGRDDLSVLGRDVRGARD